ncbi:MAG: sialidase family protein [Kiritimatiellia bacterium]
MIGKYANASYADMLQEALQPMQPNFAPGAQYADDQRQFQGIPGIARAPGGRLWAIWFSGGQGESPFSYVVLVTSGDDGATWSAPVMVVDPPDHVRAYDPCIWVDPNGRLWVFWTQAHTLHDGQWGVWTITTEQPDLERPEWTAPRRLMDGVMLNKPTVLSNGEWLFPVSLMPSKSLGNEKRMLPKCFQTNLLERVSPDEQARINERAGAWVCATCDGGATFAWRGRARASGEVASHNEHMVVERRDGSLWMLMRTSYGIGQSVSTDAGATWSPVTESGIPHTASRFFLSRLQSGRLLLVKHGPMETQDAAGNPQPITRDQLTAYLSEDDGRTWPHRLLLEERGCSYPDGMQDADGTINIIYDHKRREEKQILLVRFNEEDVIAGKFASPRAVQRMLVNQATGIITEEQSWQRLKEQDGSREQLIYTGI